MMKMEQELRKKEGRTAILAAVGWLCLILGMGQLYITGPLQDSLKYCGNAVRETALLLLWSFFVCWLPEKKRWKYGGISLGALVFIWCHQAFLPFVVSGMWLGAILLLGNLLRLLFMKLEGVQNLSKIWDARTDSRESLADGICGALAADFVLGAALWIGLCCLTSLFHQGGLGHYRKMAVVLSFAAVLLNMWLERVRLFDLIGLYLKEPEYGDLVKRQQREYKKSYNWVKKGQRDGRLPEEESKEGLDKTAEKTLSTVLKKTSEARKAAWIAILVTMVCMQFGRMNLKPDYDSIHYGLRSPFILDNGGGIYEALGNINLVYTYPKGYELLTFPLSGTATYGYQLAFNIWMAILVLILTWGITTCVVGTRKGSGLTAAALVSLIPGVMNMSITAKSDLATLVCQLAVLFALLMILKQQEGELRRRWFFLAMAAVFVSFSFKPTSVVFSTILAVTGCVLMWKLGICFQWGRTPEEADGRTSQLRHFAWAAALVPAIGAWLGTWARTWLMTGVPTTSIFTSFWRILGFQVKWPYAFSKIPSRGLELKASRSICFFLGRLYEMLFGPDSPDMAHVWIAWGSSLMVLFFTVWLLWGPRLLTVSGGRQEKHGKRTRHRRTGRQAQLLALSWVAAALLGISLLSIYLLWQVDGNYFMLLYVVMAILAVCFLSEAARREEALQADTAAVSGQAAPVRRRGQTENGQTESGSTEKTGIGTFGRQMLVLEAALIIAFQILLSLTTNWAGSTGFSTWRWLNAGFCDHQQMIFEEKCQQGNQSIWCILAQDPKTRVIAFASHLEGLQFPCNIQSYYDVTGSGGNVRLVKTLDNFKEFLSFAGTEYIYVQAGHLEAGSREADVVRYLIEDGSLADIIYENGNMLARVNVHQERPVNAGEESRRYGLNIRMRGAQEDKH